MSPPTDPGDHERRPTLTGPGFDESLRNRDWGGEGRPPDILVTEV